MCRLLQEYLNDRIRFYNTGNFDALDRVDTDTAQFQVKLWNPVHSAASANPTPVVSRIKVIDAQRYTQAAYRDRIPPDA